MPPKPSFEKAFSKLIQHLQREPQDEGKTRRLLRAASKTVSRQNVSVHAGLVLEDTLQDPGVHGRMHARGIEALQLLAGAPERELLALACALAADDGDIPSTEMVAVALVVTVTPGEMADPAEAGRSRWPPSAGSTA